MPVGIVTCPAPGCGEAIAVVTAEEQGMAFGARHEGACCHCGADLDLERAGLIGGPVTEVRAATPAEMAALG